MQYSRFKGKIQELRKKYEPCHSSARQLFASISPKIALTELIFDKKFKSKKKLIVYPHNFSLIIDPETEIFKSKSTPSIGKTQKKTLKKRLSPLPKSLFQTTEIHLATPVIENKKVLNVKPATPVIENRKNRILRLTGTPMMNSYEKLMRTCSEIKPKKKIKFKNVEKKIRNLSRVIKKITDESDERALMYCL